MDCSSPLCLIHLLLVCTVMVKCCSASDLHYSDALEKSILFFEGQRSGKLPTNQRLTWRGDSGLSDGSSYHVDLVGGYYDAGDNVKFGLPMAFTMTMVAWGIIEFGSLMPEQVENTRAALRWSTDYLLKASTATPNSLYVQVGEPNMDHRCWERPDDMDTSRNVYEVSTQNPGSDVAAETTATLECGEGESRMRQVKIEWVRVELECGEGENRMGQVFVCSFGVLRFLI